MPLKMQLKWKKVIFYLYDGNDFSDFRYSKIDKIKYNSENHIDRNLSLPKKIVKSTNSLNIIYREVIKKYFFKNRINEKFVKDLYTKQKNKYIEVPYENALERVNNTPNEYKKLFSSDILNVNCYPENIFEYKDYIVNNMYLTDIGNKKLAKFTYDLLAN